MIKFQFIYKIIYNEFMAELNFEQILPLVQKPARYIGNELNSVHKDWSKIDLKFALAYPDTYEIGLPNQGLQILYEILNERPDAVAERAYAPWTDMEASMRTSGLPRSLRSAASSASRLASRAASTNGRPAAA